MAIAAIAPLDKPDPPLLLPDEPSALVGRAPIDDLVVSGRVLRIVVVLVYSSVGSNELCSLLRLVFKVVSGLVVSSVVSLVISVGVAVGDEDSVGTLVGVCSVGTTCDVRVGGKGSGGAAICFVRFGSPCCLQGVKSSQPKGAQPNAVKLLYFSPAMRRQCKGSTSRCLRYIAWLA